MTQQDARERFYDIVFDGPPGPVSGRFVEVEDEHGRSFSLGEWLHSDDGYWRLRVQREDEQRHEALVAAADAVWEAYRVYVLMGGTNAVFNRHVRPAINELRALAGSEESAE